jgi:hypothetical protein
MYIHVKPAYFGLKIMLLFTDFFPIQFRIRIRILIRNVYFGSESDPDPAKSFGFFRIRIRNTGSSQVVRASDCQCKSRNSPVFDPSILRHSGI